MKTHRWEDLLKAKGMTDKQIAEGRARARLEVLEMDLQAMRKLVGKSQVAASRASGISQPQISKLERSEDHLLSTLRRYVKGLGGELEVVAHFGDKTIRLHSV